MDEANGRSAESGLAPRVSVVIPTWNGERYIDETLRSVHDQTFRDFELIVIDDGSTDGTRRVLEPHLARIRYVHQENAGQSAARNRGARLARGRYLALLDHDDCWEPTYLETLTAYLEKQPEVGLLMPELRIISDDGTRTPRVLRKRLPGRRYTTRSLLEGEVGSIRNPMIRREVFLGAGGYDTTICGPEDCDLWLRLSFLTEMHHYPEPLMLYRVHGGNYSKNHLDNARQWLLILEKLERLHPEFAREHRRLLEKNEAKHQLRIGRELLGAGTTEPAPLTGARRALIRTVRLDPTRLRPYFYAALSFVPGIGSIYGRWRRFELSLRDRLFESRLLARLSDLRAGLRR